MRALRAPAHHEVVMLFGKSFPQSGHFTQSLEKVYVATGVRESRNENRGALWLNVVIVLLMLVAIGTR